MLAFAYFPVKFFSFDLIAITRQVLFFIFMITIWVQYTVQVNNKSHCKSFAVLRQMYILSKLNFQADVNLQTE